MDKRHNKVVAWLQQIESERSSIITSLDYLIKKVSFNLLFEVSFTKKL